MIIGLHGHSGVGKNAAARLLTKQGFTTFALTAPIRRTLLLLDPRLEQGWTLSSLVEEQGWTGALRHPLYGNEVRRLMVALGRGMRQDFGDNVLIDPIDRAIAAMSNGTQANIVVTDIRLPHEAEWVISRGGLIISIQRDGATPASEDVTERPLPPALVSFTITGTDEEDIATKVLEQLSPTAVPNIAYDFEGALR